MADPTDMIVLLLREMRSENVGLHEQTRRLIEAPDKRLSTVEAAQNSFRPGLTADSRLSKLVSGEFEGRIETLERKVRKLESRT